jgi:hypothetical protein
LALCLILQDKHVVVVTGRTGLPNAKQTGDSRELRLAGVCYEAIDEQRPKNTCPRCNVIRGEQKRE